MTRRRPGRPGSTGFSINRLLSLPFILALLWLSPPALAAETTVTTAAGPRSLLVDIADTEAARNRGLMYRPSLADGHGMLFLFPDAAPRRFWMKNVLFPIDIIFIDADWRVRTVHASVPPCRTPPCAVYSSSVPARYVLETVAGWCDTYGVKPGDRVEYRP